MAVQLPFGPLAGPSQPRNRRRNPFWRFRRFLFVIAVFAAVAAGATWSFVSQVELGEDDFDQLIETTYICTGEVVQNCGPENASNELAIQGEDRVVVDYEDIPEVLIQAVVSAEDKTFFDHRGIDPGGLMRAAYQVGKRYVTDDGGSLQGGSTITQQYIKLVTEEDEFSISRKAREMVRAIKLEQELASELGSKEAAKQQILERYLNRAYFGRGAYGVQAAAQAYFEKDVGEVNLPESAYLAGLLKNPLLGDAYERPDEGNRRRSVTLGLMVEQGYISIDELVEAESDTWPNLIARAEVETGLGAVKGSEHGTEYFIRAVRDQLDQLFPNGEYYSQSLRVYTTLDPELQELGYDTLYGKLTPSNQYMPDGALLAINDNGEVLAMIGGPSWAESQVNLTTGRSGGGSGFQAGSQMKVFALAEFIEQGFSPASYYEAPWTIKYPQSATGFQCGTWSVRGGVTNNKARPSHRTVMQATAGSLNTVYAQIAFDIGAAQMLDMATRLGIESEMEECPSTVLGTNAVSPLEMAASYANLAREGERIDPALIQRIEDVDGNILCWYPEDSCEPGGQKDRRGEQVVDPSVARQVNAAMEGVVSGGTGRAARLIDPETEEVRPAAGKTGTTQNNKDAWFTGFTCGMTTSVWVGYPGVPGRPPVYMNDNTNAETAEKEENAGFSWPTMAEIFGTEDYNNSRGNGDITGGEIPAELWHDFMMEATKGFPPCESLPTESPGAGQAIIGQELLTTLLHCAEPDPALVAAAQTTTVPSTDPSASSSSTDQETTQPSTTETTQPPSSETQPPTSDDGGGNGGDDESALYVPGRGGGVANIGLRRSVAAPAQDPTTTVPEPTAPPTTVATTEPCIPIDLDGQPIESTTVPQGGQGGGGQGGQGGGGQGGGGQDG